MQGVCSCKRYYKSRTACTEVGSPSKRKRKPSLLRVVWIAKLSRSISATMRLSFSSRAIWISRRSNSLPRPRCWYWSEIKTASSAALSACSLLSRPTPNMCGSPVLRISVLRHKHHLAFVIAKANANQSLVGSAHGKAQGAEVSQIHRSVGERLVEFDHRWFIFHTNWPDGELNAALHYPRRNVSRRIGSSSRIQVCSRHTRPSSAPGVLDVTKLLSAHRQSLAKLHSRFTHHLHPRFKFLFDGERAGYQTN